MAKQKAKESKEEIASRRTTKVIKARHIAYICAKINGNRLPNGRLRRGAITKALNEHKRAIPWVTVDLIKKGLKKSTPVSTTITRAISDLTDPTYGSSPNTETEQDNAIPPSTIAAETVEATSSGRADTTNLAEASWSVSQLKTLISFKKRKTDVWQQPKTKAELINKWNELKNRETPPPSPAHEEQHDEDEEENAVIEAV